MAGTDVTQPRDATKDTGRDRHRLARLVVVASFLTLFLIVVAFLALAQGSNRDAATAAQNVFNSILPVLAGWVGTVLAYYFSSASQDRTSDSLDKVIKKGMGDGGSDIPVSDKMIPVSKISKLQKLDEKSAEQISLKELQDIFKEKLPNGTAITRLMFVENGVFKYVLHNSLLNDVLANSPTGASAPSNFADMLKDPKVVNQASRLVAFVPVNATLADAKAALDKVSGAYDIIVTTAGNPTDPMQGWLTNVDLIKALQ